MRGRPGVRIALAVVLVPLLVVGSFFLARDWYFYPSPPTPDVEPASDRLMGRRQDLDYFRHYLALDRSYSDDSRARAETLVAGLKDRLADLTDGQFQLEIARAVALADNGHSNIWMGRFSQRFGRVPVRFYWFADGIYVVSAASAHAELLGARLTGVGGAAIAEVMESLQTFIGGTPEAFRAYRGPPLVESPVALHAAGFSDAESSARYAFRKDGALIERTLPVAAAQDEPFLWPHQYLLAGTGGGGPDWVGLAAAGTPLYLQEPQLEFRALELPAYQALFVQYRRNSDGADASIAAFGEAVESRLGRQRPRFVILDQRFNGGGDYTTTMELMTHLPARVPEDGRVFVLTGPATFSAGINSVAFVRGADPQKVTIVGSRIGDRERTWGETNDFELPNSGLGITFSTGLHDVAAGCHEFPHCYWTNFFHNVAAGSLDPDVRVATTFGDYASGRDPVLERVLTLMDGGG